MTIQSLIDSATPGSIVSVPAGTYDVSGLVVGNVTLQASGNVTLTGSMTVNGPNAVIKGFNFQGGAVDIGTSEGVTIQNCVFNGGANSVHFDSAHGALITNNVFNNVAGNVIDGWGLDQSTISNNQFYNCWQPINLDFNNDPTHGRDITISQNYFTGTGRMDIEVGPGDTANTSNMVVSGNWSENRTATIDNVAYSLVQSHGVNTLVEDNYAQSPGLAPAIGIELNGSGEIAGNYITGFDWGAIAYGADFNVHDNAFVNDGIAVVNQNDSPGIIANNLTDPTSFA